jgi:hypothetical protein
MKDFFASAAPRSIFRRWMHSELFEHLTLLIDSWHLQAAFLDASNIRVPQMSCGAEIVLILQ